MSILNCIPLMQAAVGHGPGPGHGPGFMDGWGHFFFRGWFFWLLLVLAIMAIVVMLSRRRPHKDDSCTPREGDALDILNKRYAAGDITREEYERMRRDMGC